MGIAVMQNGHSLVADERLHHRSKCRAHDKGDSRLKQIALQYEVPSHELLPLLLSHVLGLSNRIIDTCRGKEKFGPCPVACAVCRLGITRSSSDRNRAQELSVLHEMIPLILYTTAMATLEDVARFLGLSKSAVRNRVSALGETLDAYLSRGTRNRLIFEGEAVAILRRLEELREHEGLPIQEAAERLKWELSYAEQPPGVYIVLPTDIESSVLKDVVQELCDERDHWRSYAKMLQSVLPASLKWLSNISPSVPSDPRLN